ncbi:hypothetical protein [Fervidobacterium sp.]
MGIFKNRIVAYNFNEGQASTLIANYRNKKIRIKSYHQRFIQPDPEDLVVVNIPWDIIQTAFLELPPIKKESDRIRVAELELRRIYNLNEDINVSCVPSLFGKNFALFVRRADFMRFLETNGLNVIPDIAYPSILLELLLVKKLPGRWVYVVLGEYTSGVIVMDGTAIMNLRIIDISTNEISHLIKEETGFELSEIENSGNEELIEQSKKILETIASDVFSIISREIIISINTTELEKLSIDLIDGIVLITKSKLIRNTIFLEESEMVKKFTDPVFLTKLYPQISISELGLVYRGGVELGKVKSIIW